MAYQDFAYCYDLLNKDANYRALCDWITQRFHQSGFVDGIVVDLGCGTGEMTLLLARAGFDMIAVDASCDMLAVLREKMTSPNNFSILMLQQNLTHLDLFGTVQGAVSTFDTLNHLSPNDLHLALKRISLFMEPGSLLIFDANTPFKHEKILADYTFRIPAEEDSMLLWENNYNPKDQSTEIIISMMKNSKEVFREVFSEYAYNADFWRTVLAETGFDLLEIYDGETFENPTPSSARYLMVAQKTKEDVYG